ncbi:hypothetical protein BOFL111202_17715 [Bordetella flabilis]
MSGNVGLLEMSMKKKTLTGEEAAAALAKHAVAADGRGQSWALDPTVPGRAEWFRVTIEGVDTPTVVRLSSDGTWTLTQ